jgi:arsenate reductase
MFADSFDVYSAGIEKHGLNPLAVRAMAEIGVDISRQTSKTLSELDTSRIDYVISVCGHADQNCPPFPAKIKTLHHGFDDPPKLAQDAADEDEAMGHYRRVRDEIMEFVKGLPGI